MARSKPNQIAAYKLPKSTLVNGERWRVVAKSNPTLEGEEVEGVCHFDTRTIEVNTSSGDEYTILSNYFHEVAHAIVATAGIDIDDKLEHALIASLERWLATNVDLRPRARKPKSAASSPSKAKRGQRGR